MFIEELKNKYLSEYTIVNYNVNGVDYPYSEEERVEIINVWVNNHIEDCFNNVRNHRNALLSMSDWTQTSDAPVNREAWAEYRQLLRDFPETIKTVELLENPVWPMPPNN